MVLRHSSVQKTLVFWLLFFVWSWHLRLAARDEAPVGDGGEWMCLLHSLLQTLVEPPMVEVFCWRGIRQEVEIGIPGNSGIAKKLCSVFTWFYVITAWILMLVPLIITYINVSWLQKGFEWVKDKVTLIFRGQKKIILWVHIPCFT